MIYCDFIKDERNSFCKITVYRYNFFYREEIIINIKNSLIYYEIQGFNHDNDACCNNIDFCYLR